MQPNEAIRKMFNAYAKAFSRLELDKHAEFFADNFIMAGPKGVISITNKEFAGNAEKAAQFYRSVGHTGAEMLSIEQSPITSEFVLVKVHWAVTFEKTGDIPVEFDASYIVNIIPAEPEIIMAISHEDEDEAMKKLGLLNSK